MIAPQFSLLIKTGSLLFCIFFTPILTAQQRFATQSVSIFKNNTAFFMKQGEVAPKAGVYQMSTEDIPSALFGTLWLISPKGKLQHIQTRQALVSRQEQVSSIAELLEANIGATVQCRINSGDHSIIKGKVLSISAKGLLLIETMEGGQPNWQSFYASEVAQLSFIDIPNTSLEQQKEEYVLEVSFADQSPKQSLKMMYLEGGISWSPNYLIELTSENKARLTLKAEIRNEAESIINSPINFVVGIPNFNYADRLSAMVDFLGGTDTDLMPHRNNLSNAAFSQQVSYVDSRSINDITGPGMVEEEDASRNEDLYFYTTNNISLPKGGRGQFPLFSSDISVEHLYEVNLSSNSVSASYYQKSMRFSSEEQNQVFHSIKIPNTTKHPWTTGTAMVMNATGEISKPISQDLLKYTPPTGTTFVKLTAAPDVRVLDGEKELKRENQKIKWRDGYSYDLITVEGQIQLKNYKDKEIRLSVVRTVSGAAKSSDTTWKTEEAVNISNRINKSTEICWDLSLKAGEERTIAYTYEVYVRY